MLTCIFPTGSLTLALSIFAILNDSSSQIRVSLFESVFLQ
ncbi:hypothetical protein OROMI_024554 [Orobanche minor]